MAENGNIEIFTCWLDMLKFLVHLMNLGSHKSCHSIGQPEFLPDVRCLKDMYWVYYVPS